MIKIYGLQEDLENLVCVLDPKGNNFKISVLASVKWERLCNNYKLFLLWEYKGNGIQRQNINSLNTRQGGNHSFQLLCLSEM